MNTYGFTSNAGYIGGSGVVMANDPQEAIKMINIIGKTLPMPFQVTTEDLKEIKQGSVYILTTGDY